MRLIPGVMLSVLTASLLAGGVLAQSNGAALSPPVPTSGQPAPLPAWPAPGPATLPATQANVAGAVPAAAPASRSVLPHQRRPGEHGRFRERLRNRRHPES